MSSTSSESKSSILARPLCENALWKDLTPLKQDDGEAQGQMPVVPINYPAHYSDVMDIFRAILQKNERSMRAFYLTEAVIDCNSANYSAWHFRRLCLQSIQGDLRSELEWVATVAMDTPKNYQLWHHRRCLLEELMQQPANANQVDTLRHTHSLIELELTKQVLKLDAKNYHAWSHRQWVLKFAMQLLPSTDIVEKTSTAAASAQTASSASAATIDTQFIVSELSYIDELLTADVRNNSAWNQRFFVRSFLSSPTSALASHQSQQATEVNSNGLSFTSGMSADVISEEISYAGSKLVLASHNESPWNYLEGLMKQQQFSHHDRIFTLINTLPEMQALVGVSTSDESERSLATTNRFAMSLLVELFQSLSQYEKAAQAADKLAQQLDPVRSKYWAFRNLSLREQIKA